jgi:hypothetical protein
MHLTMQVTAANFGPTGGQSLECASKHNICHNEFMLDACHARLQSRQQSDHLPAILPNDSVARLHRLAL